MTAWECGASGCAAVGNDTASQTAHLRTAHPRPRAIVGELTLDLGDGVLLRDQTDVGLARQWAAHVRGERWARMTWQAQNDDVTGALAALREAHEENAR